MLVNVNGVPQDGLRARLAATRLLLPVLSLPPGPRPGDVAVVPTVPPDAAGLTLLYPLVDTPHRLPTVPGEQTLLVDDELARSLAPQGRLGGLLTAFAEGAPAGSPVRDATCLAVDPDLVATAAAMRQGYAVRGPTGTVPGTGADVAGTWLDTLATAARDGCVVALPFADADLVALARGQLADLGSMAVADAGAVVTEALGTPVLQATTWPSGGVLDEPALDAVAAGGVRAVVLDAGAVDGGATGETGGAVPLAAGASSLLGVLTDPLLARAAAAPDAPTRAVAGAATTVPAASSPPLATQDAVATLVFRSQGADEQPVVVAPPHVWSTDATGARALLAAVDLLLDSGRMQAGGLADVVAAGPTTPGGARRPADPLQAGSRDIPPAVLESVREMRADVLDLRSAAVPDTGVGATVDATFDPLLQAAVRPTSATWHGRPDLARSTASAAATRIGELRDSIRVLAPPSPYSLGTSDAPLLLTVANGLPVTMEVRVSISSTTGLRAAPIPPQRIPPLGRRQVQVSAEVVRVGAVLGGGDRAQSGGPRARPAEPPAGALHRLRHDHRVVDGVRGRAADRPGGAPGGAPDPGRGEPARPDRPGGGAARAPGPAGGAAAGSGNGAAEPRGVGPAHTGSTPAPGRPGTPDDAGPDPARPGTPDASGTGPPPVMPDTAGRPRRRGPSLGRASGLMAVASLVSRITGFLRQTRPGHRARPGRGQRLLHGREHPAQHRLRAAARRRADQRDGPVAGPRADRGRRRRRGLHPAPAHRGGRWSSPSRRSRRWRPRRCSPASTSATAPAPANPQLATAFAWLLLPQIFFYGVGALLGAILNTRGVFAPFAWAPVLNNVVVLAVLGRLRRRARPRSASTRCAQRPEAAGPRASARRSASSRRRSS